MEKLTIIKVGGAIVEDDSRLDNLLGRFATLPGHKILVHGGGRRATKVAAALGIESRMVEGRRVTGRQMLDVVTMVYAGLVNKNIVARLDAKGIRALGLTGADATVIRSEKRPITNGTDYGYVGDVKEVNGPQLQAFLEQGLTPVLAPLTFDAEGRLLNTNADTIAGETACAMAGLYDTTLIYCFEKKGVMGDDGSVIPHLNRARFEALKASGTLSGGMIPKVENALLAVERGVRRVFITQATAIDGQEGTIIQ